MISLQVNGEKRQAQADPALPLLWLLRDHLQLKGTKYGCGIGQCGACTVHVEGEPVRSCVFNTGAAAGKKITTIEGLRDTRVQRAWLETNVAQCGYCQAGQIMSAAALLRKHPHPSETQLRSAMTGNLCRCGSYPRIVAAVRLAERLK